MLFTPLLGRPGWCDRSAGGRHSALVGRVPLGDGTTADVLVVQVGPFGRPEVAFDVATGRGVETGRVSAAAAKELGRELLRAGRRAKAWGPECGTADRMRLAWWWAAQVLTARRSRNRPPRR